MLLEKMNLSSNSIDDDKNDLVDLSSDRDEDNHSSYVSTVPFNSSTVSSDVKPVNNISNNLSAKLPLYSVMVGGFHFKILIDSGASANYAHPKLLHYAKSTANVKNQAVETANGQQACIKQVINFNMFLGDDYKFKNNVNAFVFDSKFDIILGNTWLKQVKPSPDWFLDTWTPTDQNGLDTTILKPLNQSQVSPLSNVTDYTNQSLSINTENKHNNAILNNAATHCSTFFDIKPEYDSEDSQEMHYCHLISQRMTTCFRQIN